MADDSDDLIRSRAYEIWESEGSPHGRHADHWTQAATELAEAQAAARAVPAPETVPAPRRGRKAAAAAASPPVAKGRRKKDG